MEFSKLDFSKKKFKKFGGEIVEDVVPYIRDYVSKGNDIRVMVGCDSQQKRRFTMYALTIVLYDEDLHKGAHIIFMRLREKKERDLHKRLMNESLYSLDLANWLDVELEGIYKRPRFKNNKYDGSFPTKKIEIHVDINPYEGLNKQNKSNSMYHSIMGMLCGMGYSTKSKSESYAASCAADLLVK